MLGNYSCILVVCLPIQIYVFQKNYFEIPIEADVFVWPDLGSNVVCNFISSEELIILLGMESFLSHKIVISLNFS